MRYEACFSWSMRGRKSMRRQVWDENGCRSGPVNLNCWFSYIYSSSVVKVEQNWPIIINLLRLYWPVLLTNRLNTPLTWRYLSTSYLIHQTHSWLCFHLQQSFSHMSACDKTKPTREDFDKIFSNTSNFSSSTDISRTTETWTSVAVASASLDESLFWATIVLNLRFWIPPWKYCF